MVALESGLIRGMVQGLPAPGSVMSASQLGDFLELAGVVLKVVYRVEDVPPPQEEAVLLLEARPARRSEVPAPSNPLGPPPPKQEDSPHRISKDRVVSGKEGGRKPGALVAIITEALQAANGMPMSVKALADWARKKRAAEVAKYPNVNNNIYQACIGLARRGVLMDDVERGVTVYYLAQDGRED